MAATNFTPIQLYFSTTASAVPLAANLAQGELAINITDGKLYYEDNGGVVQVIATKGAGTIGGSNTQIQYNNAGALAGNAAMTFNSGTSTTTLTTLNLTNALGAIYGGTAQSSYTQGDFLYASAANTLSKLGIGTVNYILTSSGSVPQWSAPSSISVLTATNLAGGLGGSVPYQSAVDTTTFLAIGAANRVMTSTGTAPQWVTSLTSLTGVSSSSITNTSLTSGRVVYSGASGVQTDSASLTFNGTTLSAGGFSTTGLSTLVQTVKIGDSNFSGVAVFAPATPAKLYMGTGTVTDVTSAVSQNNTYGAIMSLGITPIAASNTGVTYTNASTLYIAGAPSAGTNISITNPYALYIAAGNVYLGGGTENGVAFLNGSKVLTTGSALTFDGTNLGVGLASPGCKVDVLAASNTSLSPTVRVYSNNLAVNTAISYDGIQGSGEFYIGSTSNSPVIFKQSNTEALRLTSTSLYTASTINVGIGTSSPGVKLETSTARSATVTSAIFGQTGTGAVNDVNKITLKVQNTLGGGTGGAGIGAVLEASASNKTGLSFYYDSGTGAQTDGMRLDSSGNLGVGVTPNANAGQRTLNVANFTGTFNALTMGANGTNAGYIGYNMGNTSTSNTWRYQGADTGSALYFAGNEMRFMLFPLGTAAATTSGTQAMTLDASGNLGIGNTLPNARLDVRGDTGSSVNAIMRIRGSNATSRTTRLQFEDYSGALADGTIDFVIPTAGSAASALLQMGLNGAAALSIDINSNVMFGTTTIVSPNPGFSFSVGNQSQMAIGHLNATTGTYYAYFNYNGSIIGSITQNGTTGVLYNLTSDYRLKNDQQALTGAKDFIMALKPKKWQWWDGSGEGVGFVAHEFMEVAKHSGHGEKDAVDADGKPKYQSIQPSSSEVMANLVSFIQEQQALITQLTARITALEGASA